jgi:hypothetical protein
MPNYFGPELQQIAYWLREITGRGSGQYGYPDPWSPRSLEREGDGETLRDYFDRVVEDGILDEDAKEELEQYALEESALVVLSLESSSTTIRSLSIQAFVSARNLVDTYLEVDRSRPLHYLRFDYEPHQPGRLFKEPQPHVHVRPEGEPRMSVPMTEERHLLTGFFDILYRNYFYETWREWARVHAWEPLARRHRYELELFDRIAEAYESGRLEWIRNNYQRAFEDLKDAIGDELDDFFPETSRASGPLSVLNL